jgi:hypothetical protein
MQALTRRFSRPASRWARIPMSVLLILGGCLSILPFFGLSMLPPASYCWPTTSRRSSGAGGRSIGLRGAAALVGGRTATARGSRKNRGFPRNSPPLPAIDFMSFLTHF